MMRHTYSIILFALGTLSSATAQPANNAFSAPVVLAGEDFTFKGSTVGASFETGEPETQELTGGSVWFTWTAPSQGEADLRVVSSFINMDATVFTGIALSSLTKVGKTLFSAQAGVTYYIRLAGSPASFQVQFVLSHMRIVSLASNTVYPFPTNLMVRLEGVPQRTWQFFYLNQQQMPLTSTGTIPEEFNLPYLHAGTQDLFIWAVDATWSTFRTPVVHFTISGYTNAFFTNRTPVLADTARISVDLRGSVYGNPTNPPCLWWTWTPTHSGWLHVSSDASYAVSYNLYTGDSLDRLTAVSRTNVAEHITEFPVTAGTAYQFQIISYSQTMIPYWIDFNLVTPPANDAFEKRKLLTGTNATDEAMIGKATIEPGEPPPLNEPGLATLWYEYQVPSDGWLSVNGYSAGMYLVTVWLYEGDSLATLKPLGGRVEGPVRVRTGQNLKIAEVYHQGGIIQSRLELQFNPSPTNDDFALAQPFTAPEGQVEANLQWATSQAEEPSLSQNTEMRTIWYRWMAPTNGRLHVELQSLNDRVMPATLNIYAGTSLSHLTKVFPPSPDDWYWSFYPESVYITNGATYYFQVTVPDIPSHGNVPMILSYQLNPQPENDEFEKRAVLQGSSLYWSATCAGATGSAQETYDKGYGGHSVWWEWQAPQNGWVCLSATAANGYPGVGIFQGTKLEELKSKGTRLVFPSPTQCKAWFQVQAGQSYIFLLDYTPLIYQRLPGIDAPLYPSQSVELMLSMTTIHFQEPIQDGYEHTSQMPFISLEQSQPSMEGAISNAAISLLSYHTNSTGISIATNAISSSHELPFSFALTNMAPAHYWVCAQVVDVEGHRYEPQPVFFNIWPTIQLWLESDKGQAKLTVNGMAGRDGVLEQSTDLSHWELLSLLNSGYDTYSMELPVTADAPKQYLRVHTP